MRIAAEHPALPSPIHFSAVGYADALHRAARIAAEQWFEVVFPVLHSRFADHETRNVIVGKLTSIESSTGRQFYWRVHGGPIRVLAAGGSAKLSAPPVGEFMQVLMSDIAGISATSVPFWLDAYAARKNDGGALADCRLSNVRWVDGTERLMELGRRLDIQDYALISHRQFVLFEPVAEPPVLAPARQKKGWWRRMFGG